MVTHLLKLLDKMCKYEMDPASIVEDTGRTQIAWEIMGLLPDTLIRGLRMRRECREDFPRHRLQR